LADAPDATHVADRGRPPCRDSFNALRLLEGEFAGLEPADIRVRSPLLDMRAAAEIEVGRWPENSLGAGREAS